MTRHIITIISVVLLLSLCERAGATAQRPPNFVIIFADDLGYTDVGSFGATGFATPHLDQMAKEGVRLTNFYVAQAVCSASRAALLTGCYPNRIGISGALDHKATHGINAREMTIAEVLKQRGYATAIYGKWHLGHHPQFLPTRHGFDEYYGLPYSNDMWPRHPVTKNYYPDLPLIENERVIKLDPDQSQLTTQYTERAVSFIERNKNKPFFLYVPHTMPHVPLFVSDKFKGKSPRGIYGDVVAEIDWSVGQILAALKRNGLDDNTLVIFTSDNGPWWEYGDHAGTKGMLRGSKGTAFEGGVREPFIARWPRRIPAGTVNHRPAMTIDMLPTIAKLAGAKAPTDRIIDGRDIWPLLNGRNATHDPHDALYFYYDGGLNAVRSGKWKLHLPHPYREVPEQGHGGQPGKTRTGHIELSLYDLDNDISESTNVADRHPEVVRRLMHYVARARADLGDGFVKRTGRNVRPAGKLTDATASMQAGKNNPAEKEWTQLFNGRDLTGWEVKIRGYDLNDNFGNTFRVENGLLKVGYEKYDQFNDRFGHIFTREKFSHYIIAVEYRFVGEQAKGGADWATRNSGIMVHSQSAQSMGRNQDFPISIEVQLLGGLGKGPRPTANLCTPGTHVEMNGKLFTTHCVNSSSQTYDGDQWVRVEVEVLGNERIRHIVAGQTVLSYERPQIGGEVVSGFAPAVKQDGTMLSEGYIALQSESHPVEFRKVELLNLCGCTDPKATNYKSYYVKSDNTKCRYERRK